MTATVCEQSGTVKRAPAARWERVRCNLCGADAGTTYHREKLIYFDLTLDFEIVRCGRCGLVYTNPRLADHNGVYLWASSADEGEIEAHAAAKTAVFAGALERITHWTGGATGRLLDVGCGSGHFLGAARARGFEVCGVEAAATPAAYAGRKFGVPVIHDDVYAAELPTESFDVITAWDVIEHVSDPRRFLERCVGWLREDGVMGLRFPSARWQKAKAAVLHGLLGSKRPVFGGVIHLYFFSERTFGQLAREAGLEVLETRTTALEANTGSKWLDGVKRLSNVVVSGVEALTQSHWGNLEVYCRKARR
jgi:cyclopropane fatty-acyl-phospholipid synthase-like methyltransferase